eukprot:s744_g4.t1
MILLPTHCACAGLPLANLCASWWRCGKILDLCFMTGVLQFLAMRERLAALLAEVENSAGDGRKKLSPEEIERKRKEAEELGDKCKIMSKKERSEQNKSRKEKAGQRQAKTGSKNRKFEGEGATSKEEKKKKNTENVKKRFGIA